MKKLCRILAWCMAVTVLCTEILPASAAQLNDEWILEDVPLEEDFKDITEEDAEEAESVLVEPPEEITDEEGLVYEITDSSEVVDGEECPVYESETAEEISLDQPQGINTRRLFSSMFSMNDGGTAEDYYLKMYNQIDVIAKQLYDAIEENLLNFKSPTYQLVVKTDPLLEKGTYATMVGPAVAAFNFDHMEAFWLYSNSIHASIAYGGVDTDHDGSVDDIRYVKYTINKQSTYDSFILPAYHGSWEEVEQDLDEMDFYKEYIKDEMAKQSGLYKKIEVLNDFLVDFNYYNRFVSWKVQSAADANALTKAYVPASALTRQDWLESSTDRGDPSSPVCEGYARAIKMICDEVGIPCILVCGNNHMWNYIKDTKTGSWYATDATWNDQARSNEWSQPETPADEKHQYVMVGSETLNIYGQSFLSKHPPNGVVWKNGTPFKVPTLAEDCFGLQKVLFDGAGGELEITKKDVTLGEPYGELPEVTKKDCYFLGWYTDQGEQVSADTIVTIEGTHTLHAMWREKGRIKKPLVNLKDGDEVSKGVHIIVSVEQAGATIRYTFDGSEPGEKSPECNGEIVLTEDDIAALEKSGVFKCMATKEEYMDSEIVTVQLVARNEKDYWGDITETERQNENYVNGSEVLDELWVSGVSDRVYTGKPIRFEDLHVYWGKKRLKEGTDYSVSYSGNVTIGEKVVVISGKGNYSGTIKRTYHILPVDLSSAEAKATAANVAVAYNRKLRKEKTTVCCYVNGNVVTLVPGTDYSIVYPGTDASSAEYDQNAFVNPGTYTAVIKGKGNFTGELPFEVRILSSDEGKSVEQLRIVKKDVPFAEGNMKPLLTVYDGAKPLTENVDYKLDVSFFANISAGKGYAYVEGMGSYFGSKLITFNIVGESISKVLVDGITSNGFIAGSPFIYSGKAQAPNGIRLYTEFIGMSGLETKDLVEGVDYKIAYKNNLKAGIGTMIISGMGNYTGTRQVKFKIEKCNLNAEQIQIQVDETAPYMKGGSRPSVRITNGEVGLVEGIDYRVSYKANKQISIYERATAVIVGKGNYTGTVEKAFAVEKGKLDQTVMTAGDVVFKNAAGANQPTVTLVDQTGLKLKAGVDYEKTGTIFYATKMEVENMENGVRKTVTRYANETVALGDFVPAGTELGVEIYGRGLYEGSSHKAYFHVMKKSIRGAKALIAKQVYTGNSIRPTKEDISSIYLAGTYKRTYLSDADYEIVGYRENIRKGRGYLTIKGVGDYGDSVEVSFAIVDKTMCYTVTYDPNGENVKGGMANSLIADGGRLGVNHYTRSGYQFAGWNTKADGTGQTYADREAFSVKWIQRLFYGLNITLYAQWK